MMNLAVPLPAPPSPKKSKKGFFGRQNWLPSIRTSANSSEIILPKVPIVLGLLVALLVVGWYLWTTKMNTAKQLPAKMMAEIEALIDLPTEQPQIAVVSDVEKLNQPFFADAKNGDYVIVYQQAGKVLLYRPATHKIVNFANIQIPTSATETFIQP